jgi:hypothetical protein
MIHYDARFPYEQISNVRKNSHKHEQQRVRSGRYLAQSASPSERSNRVIAKRQNTVTDVLHATS